MKYYLLAFFFFLIHPKKHIFFCCSSLTGDKASKLGSYRGGINLLCLSFFLHFHILSRLFFFPSRSEEFANVVK